MRIIGQLLILFFYSSNFCFAQKGAINIELDEISIHGTSNVNKFTLVYQTKQDGAFRSTNFSQVNIKGTDYEIIVPVDKFSNPNAQLTKDFKEMVNANQHPFIKVIIKVSELEFAINEKNKDFIQAKVMLAGTSKEISIPFDKEVIQGKRQYLMGNSSVFLTDFNITPPVKLKGLIRVNNQVLINFRLILKT
jgi:hypothetical protein